MQGNIPLLSLLIWLPIIMGALLLSTASKFKEVVIQRYAIIVCGIQFVLSCIMLSWFSLGKWKAQLVELQPWITSFDLYYHLGIDGFSAPLIILTSFCCLLVLLNARAEVKKQLAAYCGVILILNGLMVGVFSALNSILFYLFFEAMMIPMFLLIGIWGGENRIYATIKFVLYTFVGSVFLLVAILFCYQTAKNQGLANSSLFSMLSYPQLKMTLLQQKWIFWGFLIGFAVKIPMWPVHTWLPDAHTEAPTGGSIILAAITLKMGGYGLLRFILPATPQAAIYYAPWMIFCSLMAVSYIGLVAIVQKDMKKLIAYSSIAHMGFVTLGVFVAVSLSAKHNSIAELSLGIQGAMMQMISHGLVSAGLFFSIGVLYRRVHSRKIADFSGIANVMPHFAVYSMLFCLANIGLPGTSGFVGELLVILTTFKLHFGFALLSALTLIWSAGYTLWMYKRVVFGKVKYSLLQNLQDINTTERITLGCLAILVIFLGVWPHPLLIMTQSSSMHLMSSFLT